MNQNNLLVQQSSVLYLLREGMWKQSQDLCQQYYKQTQDPFFQFWKAFCYFKEGSINEAINELSLVQNKKEFIYATSSALIYYHQQQRGVDRDTMEQLKQMQNEGRKMPNDKAIQSAVYFFLFVEESRKAKDSCELLSQTSPMSQIVHGWYQLLDKEEKNLPQIFDFWTKIGGEFTGQKPLEYLLGLSKSSELTKKYQITLNTVNEIIVVYPNFQYANIEKARILMTIGDWEQSIETTQKILQSESQNIFALKTLAFFKLAREGNLNEGCERLDELVSAVEQLEEKNIQLIINISQLFSRISGRNSRILAITIGLLQKARKFQPLNADLCLEMANETLMLEDFEKAYSLFQEAAALDEGKVEYLAGMIQCRIHQGIIDDAEKQLEFVSEMQVSVGRTIEIAFLEALLESKKAAGSEATYKLIDEALRLYNQQTILYNKKRHIQQTKQICPGLDFYIKLNPDFLLTVSQMYLKTLSTNAMLAGKESMQSSIGKGTKLLETITKQIPGFTNSYLLLATGKLALGDQFEAMKAINTVLEQDNTNEDAYILHALISIKTNSFASAVNSLNQAIANNFMIRENPLFMLVKGEVEFRTEDYKACLQTMEAAYEIPGVKESINQKSQLVKQKMKANVKTSKILQFTDKERVAIFVLFGKALAKNKKDNEAKSVIQKAIQEFAGTSEEGTVMLANSEIALESGDVKKAINILKSVQKDQPTFQQSRILLADVYFKHLKDHRNYSKCYMDLIDAQPNYENYKLMGEALMKINEPEDAVRAYEQALKLKPEDDQIIRLIGNSLTQTYDYNRAISYYEAALLKNAKRNDLIVDLGKLYLRIGNIQQAEQILKWEKFVSDDFSAPTIDNLRQNSEGFLLIARLLTKQQQQVYSQAQNIENQKQAQNLLAEAQKISDKIRDAFTHSVTAQKEVIEKAKMEGGNVAIERDQLGELYYEQAKYYYNIEKDYKKSIDCSDDASKILPTSQKILQLQAETLYKLQDKVGCENKVKMIQKLNPKNDFANMMLSDLMLQKDDGERVIGIFKQMLQEKPDSYGTLAKVIDWYRRQNKLNEVQTIIQKSEEFAQNPNEPGLCFCRGLYNKWSLKPKEALTEFNIAKRNQQYAEDSLTHMIDIYLNPELDLYYTLVEESARQIDPENLKACDMILKELQTRGTQQRYIVMQSYVLMLSQQKQAIELSIQLLSQLLKQSPDCIPAMLALAIGKFIAKKQTEGKNLLKILWKRQIPSNGWEAEELERAWLLYADSFIAIQKYDQAEEVLKKCLQQNKACGKAEEYMGLIKEKEQSYIDAANHYETAFKLLNQRNLNMGYRLAFNYLKAKRFVEALNVSKLILDINPDFPKIKKEIVEKAIQSLR